MSRYLLDTSIAQDFVSRPMPQIDIMTAAIAFALGQCTVVTTDSDRALVPELSVENWLGRNVIVCRRILRLAFQPDAPPGARMAIRERELTAPWS